MNMNKTLWAAGLTASAAIAIALSVTPAALAQSETPTPEPTITATATALAQRRAQTKVTPNPRAKTKATATATATPEPTQTPAPADGSRTVTGVACIDADRNGICSPDEARVPNVIIRADNGAVAATDNSGTYTIVVPPNATLDVTIPAGYKSLDGNPRVQMMASDRLDIALVTNAAIAIPTIVLPTQPIKIELPANIAPSVATVKLDASLQPLLYALAGIGGVLLLSQLIVGTVLRGIRKTYQSSFEGQQAVWTDQRAQDIAYRLQNPDGWQMIAEQLVANALSEPVSIDNEAGILDATSEPAPKFTLSARDGREFIFTIDPALLKKQRLIQRGDRVVRLSRKSPHNQADMMMLWEYVQQTRRLWRLTPPASADWYIAVRGTARQPAFSIGPSRRTQLPPVS